MKGHVRKYYIQISRKGARVGHAGTPLRPGERRKYFKLVWPLLFETKQAAWDFAEKMDVFRNPYVDTAGRVHSRDPHCGPNRLISYAVQGTWVRCEEEVMP